LGWHGTKKILKDAIEEIGDLRTEFYADVYVPGAADEMNSELEKAMRVADFIELGQLMALMLWKEMSRVVGILEKNFKMLRVKP